MSDQRIFVRYRANEIKNELQNVDMKKLKGNATKRKVALKKVIANLLLGNYTEMILLMPEVVSFWKIEDDMEVKRICHEYVRTIGAIKPRVTVGALPDILNDLRNKDEILQMMALETLVLIPFAKFTDEAFKYITNLVNRKNASSRILKNAIYSLIQLDDWDHERVMSLVNILYEIIDQPLVEPTVRIAALKTLSDLFEKNNQDIPMKVPIDVTFELLDLIPRLNEWDTSYLLECLTALVVPTTHTDAYEMIDITLPQLQHVNTSVALSTLKYICYLLNYVDEINENVIDRLSNSVLSLLEKPHEIQFLILRNIILLLLSREKPIIQFDVSYFFIEFNDPIFIKDTKLECLYLLANENNLPGILDELQQYSTDIDIQMSRKAVRAIGNLAVKLGVKAANSCVGVLLNLLEFGVDYLVQEIISVFRNILRKYPDQFKEDIETFVKYVNVIQEAESKNAMIWIISNYYEYIPNYLQLFETFSSNVLDETLEVQFSILNSAIKFFVREQTPYMEDICMKLFKLFTEDVNDPDLRNRTFMYWRLLSIAKEQPNILSADTLKEIVDGQLPIIEMNAKLDPVILEELELNIGTITSIYLKPTAQIFRANRVKLLPNSPVLHKDKNSLRIIHDTLKPLNNLNTNSNSNTFYGNRSRSSTNGSLRNSTMNDYDKPAEKVNHLKGKRKSTINSPTKLSRKPSTLLRKLSLKRS